MLGIQIQVLTVAREAFHWLNNLPGSHLFFFQTEFYSPAWNSLHSPSWLQICGSLGLNLPCAGITGVGFHAWFPSNHFCDFENETQGLSQAKQHTLPLTSLALLKLSLNSPFTLSKYSKGDVRQTDVSSPLWQMKFYLSTAQTSWSSSLK